jgi:hypothetical protein
MRVQIDGGVGLSFDTAGEGLVRAGDTMRQRPTVLMRTTDRAPNIDRCSR